MMTSCILVITLQTEIQHGLAIGWITGLLFAPTGMTKRDRHVLLSHNQVKNHFANLRLSEHCG
jgi:hypothetical protein